MTKLILIVLLLGLFPFFPCVIGCVRPNNTLPSISPTPSVIPTETPVTVITTTPTPEPTSAHNSVNGTIPLPAYTPAPEINARGMVLRNPTWDELMEFLKKDETDKQRYFEPGVSPRTYYSREYFLGEEKPFMSKEFAQMLQANAKAAGWKCAIVQGVPAQQRAASHNWWKFDLAISYPLVPSQSIPLSNQCFR